jgi:dipeptide/tripeptide permease
MGTATEATRAGRWGELKNDLLLLARSPRELWVVYALKFLESVAYFAIYNLLIVYLSEDLGYKDVEAGSLAGTWLTAISLVTFFSGFIADAMGVRRALLIAVASCLAGRALMTFAHSRGVAITGLFVSTWGVASMLPTMTAAVRRYTRKESVSFGFSLFYVIMNVGALVAPLTLAFLRARIKKPVLVDFPLLGPTRMSSSQLIFLVATVATLLAAVLTLALIRPEGAASASSEEEKADAGPSAATPGAKAPAKAASVQNPLRIMKEVMAESAFWRFMLFVTLIVLVRLTFQHAHLTWPKYTLREFGKDFPFAAYWSINPAIVIVLTPFVTALTRKKSPFVCIVGGGILSALSVFFMAMSTSVAASLGFIVLLSLGETIWSPRLYEYTSIIAPKGREASYMGLSMLPMFFAKMVVGFLSGHLLASYCPAEGARHSQTLWMIVGVMTLAGPLLIVALRGVIQGKSRARSGDEPAAQAAE